MSSVLNYIDLPAFGRIVLSCVFMPVAILFGTRLMVRWLESREIIKARIWLATQFHSCFVLPDVKPLGRKGKFFCSWGARIMSDVVGLANCIIGASLLFDTFGASGQMSLKFFLSLWGLAVFYFMLGCGLMVQGRKEQKRIRGDSQGRRQDQYARTDGRSVS